MSKLKKAVFIVSLLSLLAPDAALSMGSSCWKQVEEGVEFPTFYTLIGDTTARSSFKQVLLYYNETAGQMLVPAVNTIVQSDNAVLDSADAGGFESCFSMKHHNGFPAYTTFDLKCGYREKVMSLGYDGHHMIKMSIFVDPYGENVYWRNPKSPGEVHVTSIERKKSMVVFQYTQSWAPETPFLVDHRRRLIFWVNFGHSSISYADLTASSGPTTVPTNADTATFNSMTLDFESGSIYWLVTSARKHVIHRYNYEAAKGTSSEVVTSFGASGDVQRSHLQYYNSSLYFLSKIDGKYQVDSFSLVDKSTSTVLRCIYGNKIIYDLNLFKEDLSRVGPSCKDLNCSDICLDGPKPQCVCPSVNTTLTGVTSNTCSPIDEVLLVESNEGVGFKLQEGNWEETSDVATGAAAFGRIDSKNEAVFWQEGNEVKSLFLNDVSPAANTIYVSSDPVTIQTDEMHRTLILVLETGNVTLLDYDNPEKFQERVVYPNDGIRRSNFKYYCQRLYWIESSVGTGDDVLQSFFFINGQTETVMTLPRNTTDYHFISDAPEVDCGPIEIHPEDVPIAEAETSTVSTMSRRSKSLAGAAAAASPAPNVGGLDNDMEHLFSDVRQLCERYFEAS